jgi:Zn-dependent peptidase ImmA (M78 family)/transcriptional regulator with XRE-family HTH domain
VGEQARRINGHCGGVVTEVARASGDAMDASDIAALFDRTRLRLARELRGLNQVELAREVGSINAASLSQFENGHARPAAPTLRRLSVALHVPVAFFATPARPDPTEEVDGFFRSLRSTTPRDRHRALAYAQLAHELTLELEKFVRLPEVDLPRKAPAKENATSPDSASSARMVREAWGIPPGPIDDLVRTLERHGIVTTRFRVGMDDVDAFSVAFPGRPIIALGADKGHRDRSRFDAAHELGHLVMHFPDQAGSKAIESEADQFAAEFLMPEADIKNELPSRADWSILIRLKAKWHVSIASLIVRAKTLEVMNERAYGQAWKALSVRGWRKREPGDLGPPESPILLQRALLVAAEGGVTLDEIIQRAGFPEDDIHTILGNVHDPRPRVEL